MWNYDFPNELRSMNHKPEVSYGGKEKLHQRFTMQQCTLQRQDAEHHSKDLALKGQISELQRESERRTLVQMSSMLQQNPPTPSSWTWINQEPVTPSASWYTKSWHCSLGRDYGVLEVGRTCLCRLEQCSHLPHLSITIVGVSKKRRKGNLFVCKTRH